MERPVRSGYMLFAGIATLLLGLWACGGGGGGTATETGDDPPSTLTPVITASRVSGGERESTAQLTITVTDPDTFYAGTKTICVSNQARPAEEDPAVPAGAQRVLVATGTLQDALALITTAGTRLLFQAGETWVTTAQVNAPLLSGVTLGRFGAGADPVIDCLSTSHNYNIIGNWGDDFRLLDLQFTASTTPADSTLAKRVVGGRNRDFLMLRCEGNRVSCLSATESTGGIVQDCVLDPAYGGGGSVGIWASQVTDMAFLGNRIAHCEAIEHNIRIQGGKRVLVAHCELTHHANAKHLLTLRGWGYPEYTEDCLISANYLAQGTGGNTGWALQVAPQNASSNEPLRRIVIERNWIEAGSPAIVVKADATVVRNGTQGTLLFVSGRLGASSYTLRSNSTDAQVKGSNPFGVASPLVETAFRPAPGTYGMGTAVRVPVWEDYFGAMRTFPADLGSMKP